MRTILRTALLAAAAALAAALLVSTPTLEAAPPPHVKTVRLDCRPGWRGSAVGQYGGVSVGLSCNNGRGSQRLDGTSGTAYSIRMGVESATIAIDCFFTGDSANVNETCGEVRLTVR